MRSTHDASRVRAIDELAKRITGLPVVDEYLVVGAHTGEVVTRGGKPDVLNEFRVRLDGLGRDFV